VDDASALFPRGKAIIRSRDQIPKSSELWCVMAVDPASSTKTWADDSAIAVMGFDTEGLGYLLDIRAGKWTESELVDQVYNAYLRTPGIRTIGFETVGFQKLYMREFQRAGESRGLYLPILKLERDNTIGKTMRIRALEPWWSKQQLIIAADCISLEDFLDQAERFRSYKKDQADDMLDAVADCLQLRVRPEAANPYEGLDDEEADRRRFEDTVEADRAAQGARPMDRASMREAYHLHRLMKRFDEEREQRALSSGGWDEFYG
jgi:hypothetical protein